MNRIKLASIKLSLMSGLVTLGVAGAVVGGTSIVENFNANAAASRGGGNTDLLEPCDAISGRPGSGAAASKEKVQTTDKVPAFE
jgi:hypothetical protein